MELSRDYIRSVLQSKVPFDETGDAPEGIDLRVHVAREHGPVSSLEQRMIDFNLEEAIENPDAEVTINLVQSSPGTALEVAEAVAEKIGHHPRVHVRL